MTRTVISSEYVPAPAAPLSQGIRKGPVLQVSGTAGPAELNEAYAAAVGTCSFPRDCRWKSTP
jgi:enamine deaminase RidA (YjgF/YER057c/UK114 family)